MPGVGVLPGRNAPALAEMPGGMFPDICSGLAESPGGILAGSVIMTTFVLEFELEFALDGTLEPHDAADKMNAGPIRMAMILGIVNSLKIAVPIWMLRRRGAASASKPARAGIKQSMRLKRRRTAANHSL